MKTTKSSEVVTSAVIFLALAVITAACLIAAQSVAGSYERMVLVSVGSGVFASGLTFFLLRAFQWRASQ